MASALPVFVLGTCCMANIGAWLLQQVWANSPREDVNALSV